MDRNFAEIAFTPGVRAFQARKGSFGHYAALARSATPTSAATCSTSAPATWRTTAASR